MARLKAGISFGVDVCRALEIDPEYVQRVELDIGADEIVRARVTRLVSEDQGNALLVRVKHYEFKAEPKVSAE